jgi:hypothetical protein
VGWKHDSKPDERDSLLHDRARALRIPLRSVARTERGCIISGSRVQVVRTELAFWWNRAVVTIWKGTSRAARGVQYPHQQKHSPQALTTTALLRLSSCETRCVLPLHGMFHAQNAAVDNQCNPDPHPTRLVSTCVTAATICGIPQHSIISVPNCDEGISARRRN